MSALNLTALNTNLGAYCREHRDELFTYMSLSLEAALSQIGVRVLDNVIDKEVLLNLDVEDLVQPGGNIDFDPTADAFKFDNRELSVDRFKVDVRINPFEWQQTYLAHMRRRFANKQMDEIPFEQFILQKMIEKISENLYRIAWYGDKTSNNLLLKTANGWLVALKAAVDNTQIPAVTLGSITASNVVTKLETMLDEMSAAYLTKPSTMIVSRKVYNYYTRVAESAVGRSMNFNDLTGQPDLYLRGSSTRLIMDPILTANNSGVEPVILTIDNNLAMGTNFIDEHSNIEIEKDHRAFDLMVDGRIGFDFCLGSTDHKLLLVNEYFN